MSIGRLEMKVGIFVVVLLGLAAAMSIKFSKTGFGLGETYSLNLHAENAGTVIKHSPVLMSGVKVGYVDSIDLLKDQNGTVVVELGIRLFAEYEGKILDQNSTFFIKSSGFLGDQYIGVTPHRGPPIRKKLEKQGWLECKKPFDIEETGQSIGEFIKNVDKAMIKVDSAVETIDGFVKKIAAEKKLPKFFPGDIIKVGVRITEGKRDRIQYFEGVCIAKKNRDLNSSFTVRKISFGEGVERTFALYSPIVDSIKVIRSGKVRRAKLYFLRDRTGKSARIAEKIKKKIGVDIETKPENVTELAVEPVVEKLKTEDGVKEEKKAETLKAEDKKAKDLKVESKKQEKKKEDSKKKK